MPIINTVKDWTEFGHRFMIEQLDEPVQRGAGLRSFRLWHQNLNQGERALTPCLGGQWQYSVESAERWANYIIEGSYTRRITYLEETVRRLEKELHERPSELTPVESPGMVDDMDENPFTRAEQVYKLILPAGNVPLRSTVTKRTGQAEYTLGDKLKVYGEKGEQRELRAEHGSLFLIDRNGNANVIPASKEVVWLAPKWAISEFLDPPEDK